jgi:hypothetical protein
MSPEDQTLITWVLLGLLAAAGIAMTCMSLLIVWMSR